MSLSDKHCLHNLSNESTATIRLGDLTARLQVACSTQFILCLVSTQLSVEESGVSHLHHAKFTEISQSVVVYTYFHAYIYLRFKHTGQDTHLSCLGCLSWTELEGFVSVLVVNEREEDVVTLSQNQVPVKL